MIIKRDGRAVPFNREKIVSAVYRAAVACGGRDQQEAERVTDDVLAMLLGAAAGPERILADGGGGAGPRGEGAHRARPRPHGQGVHRLPLRARPEARRPGEPHLLGGKHSLPQALGGPLLGNRPRLRDPANSSPAVDRGRRCADLVEAADVFYERRARPARREKIIERRDELRAVIIAGPSSSGKSTTTLKVRERLAAAGIQTVPLTVDNYFFDLEAHPEDRARTTTISKRRRRWTSP